MIKKISLIFLISILAVFPNCATDETPQSDQPPVYNITGGNNQNTGTLYLNLTESPAKQPAVKSADTRTATPVVDMIRESFKVVGTCTDGSMFELLTEYKSITIQGISVGTWTLQIEAVNKDDISIAYGEGTVEIVVNSTSTLGVTILPYSGFGQIQLTITWEEDLDNASIEGTLARSGGIPYDIPFVISGNTATASLTGPAGYYIMRVSLYDSGEVHTFVGGTVDVLRIVADETTPGLYTIIANSQYGYGELDIEMLVDMNDPINIELSGTLPRLEQGESMTVTASSQGDTDTIEYTWFLNSEYRGTGSTHTINGNLPTGQYRLDVLAFNSIGDRGGSVTYMFEILEAIVNTPGNLHTTLVAPDQIDLAWNDLSDNEDGFIIERSINGGGFVEIATMPANTASYSDTTVDPGVTYSYRIKAFYGFIESAYSNVVPVTTPLCLPPANLSYSMNPAVYSVGQQITDNTATVTGEDITFSVSPALPNGLSLNTATGIISGTPLSEAPQSVYTVTATNPGGSTSVNITITVNYPAPFGLSYSNNPAVYVVNQAITPNTATVTGQGIAFSVTPPLPSGLTLNASTGSISGTPLSEAPQALYTVTATNPGGSTSVNITITVNYPAPSGLSYSYNPVLYVVNQQITANTATVTGQGITFSVSPPLPSGLALNASTGTISGTPVNTQTWTTYTVMASNSGGSVTTALSIRVRAVNEMTAHFELNGSAADSTGNGNGGTEYGSPVYAQGADANTAISLNGTDQYIQAYGAETIQGSANWTVSFWFYLDNTGIDQTFLRFGSDVVYWRLYRASSGALYFQDNAGNYQVVINPGISSAGKWYHLVVTGEAGGMNNVKMYLNRQALTMDGFSSAGYTGCNNILYIGRSGSSYFDGRIDDVRLYNYLLPLNDIKQLYFDMKLIAGYSFEEGTGTEVYDTSDYGNDGSIFGNPVWSTGYSGGALTFDGAGDYVDCGNEASLNITDSITIGTWIKAVSAASALTITLRPNGAGNDTAIKYQSGTGTYHWDKVDEETADNDTTFVYQGDISENNIFRKDLYGLPNPSDITAQINKITVYFRAKRYLNDRAGEAMALIRTHSTGYEGSICSISSYNTWTTYTQEWAANPYTGSAWTWAEITDLQIGVALRMHYTSYYASRVACTQVYVVVSYTPSVTIAGKGTGAYAVGMDKENYVWGSINGNKISSIITNPSGTWHSLVLTYDGSAERLYVDGALANSMSLSGYISVNASDLIIGNTILGQIDELMIYNCAMSAEEIGERY